MSARQKYAPRHIHLSVRSMEQLLNFHNFHLTAIQSTRPPSSTLEYNFAQPAIDVQCLAGNRAHKPTYHPISFPNHGHPIQDERRTASQLLNPLLLVAISDVVRSRAPQQIIVPVRLALHWSMPVFRRLQTTESWNFRAFFVHQSELMVGGRVRFAYLHAMLVVVVMRIAG